MRKYDYYDHAMYDTRQAYWDHVAINHDYDKLPGLDRSKPPTRSQRRWTEQMRITLGLMKGDGYMEQHYPMTLSIASAMAKWDQRNPED